MLSRAFVIGMLSITACDESLDEDQACNMVDEWLLDNTVQINGEVYTGLVAADCYDYRSVDDEGSAQVLINTNYASAEGAVGITLNCILLRFDQGWSVEECLQDGGS